VSNQTFAVCDQVSNGLLTSPVSGLLGLAWESIASSGATPLWQQLVQSGAWDEPVMSFQLTRFTNDAQARDLEPGGSFTMGTFIHSLPSDFKAS
jgi:cathepsin D